MLKCVQSVALLLMMTMMMMTMMIMMMASVSAGPLPPSLNHSRHEDPDAGSRHLLEGKEENSTRFESQIVNNTLGDFVGFSLQRCILPTCLTANLGSSLQGGDESAGSAATDRYGIGKK